MKIKFLIISLALFLCGTAAFGQKVAVKTNLLYDATETVNAGVEFGLAPKWTLDLSGNYNGWSTSDTQKWKHWLAQPELRYWLCDRFAGHFFGLHAIGQQYEFADIDADFSFLGTDFSLLKDQRFKGWAAGAGLAYGYDFVLGKHWNLELEAGFGYVYTKYDEFKCNTCGTKVAEGEDHNYVGPTKAAINIVYLF